VSPILLGTGFDDVPKHTLWSSLLVRLQRYCARSAATHFKWKSHLLERGPEGLGCRISFAWDLCTGFLKSSPRHGCQVLRAIVPRTWPLLWPYSHFYSLLAAVPLENDVAG